MNEYLQEVPHPREQPKPSDMFRRMADRMDLNEKDGFGGAFVIVPPKDGGEPRETLILDAGVNPEVFWTVVKRACEDEIAKISEKQRMDQGFGRIR